MTDSCFQGRVALVTGGASGIGRACCEALARAGAKVAINYHTRDAEARATAQLVEATGSVAHPVRADVSQKDQVTSMVEEVSRALGPINMLVNNAGVIDIVSHEQTTLDIWQRTLDINLTGTYLTTWAVKDGMIERRFGRIVNISSLAGLRARPKNIAYAVSKAGVISLTKSLGQAIAAHNVRVNAVAPGLTDTDMASGLSGTLSDDLIAETPMGRMGTPHEIAAVVMFLLSDQSSFMTGQTVAASGGRALLP
jgi:3-oxoacyl-[acyl-carrier protein] reductase